MVLCECMFMCLLCMWVTTSPLICMDVYMPLMYVRLCLHLHVSICVCVCVYGCIYMWMDVYELDRHVHGWNQCVYEWNVFVCGWMLVKKFLDECMCMSGICGCAFMHELSQYMYSLLDFFPNELFMWINGMCMHIPALCMRMSDMCIYAWIFSMNVFVARLAPMSLSGWMVLCTCACMYAYNFFFSKIYPSMSSERYKNAKCRNTCTSEFQFQKDRKWLMDLCMYVCIYVCMHTNFCKIFPKYLPVYVSVCVCIQFFVRFFPSICVRIYLCVHAYKSFEDFSQACRWNSIKMPNAITLAHQNLNVKKITNNFIKQLLHFVLFDNGSILVV